MVQSRQPLTYRLIESVGLGGPRWHGSSWQRDHREWKHLAINLHDRHTLWSCVRSAMRAASQLPGRGPLMWMLPLYLQVNKTSDDDDGDSCTSSPFWKGIYSRRKAPKGRPKTFFQMGTKMISTELLPLTVYPFPWNLIRVWFLPVCKTITVSATFSVQVNIDLFGYEFICRVLIQLNPCHAE